MFTDIFERHPKTVMAGPYLSCEISYHIQSFFVVFNLKGLNIATQVWKCQDPGEDKSNWIRNTEIVS